MKKLFKDLMVVELASVLAGPLVGSFFAEHGAKVIKIENKSQGGDVTRQWKSKTESEDSPISAYYASANWKKEVHMLDLKDSDDYRQCLRYVRSADVVISNFQKITAQKLKIDYDSIKSVAPHLLYAQLVAYAWDDPRPGYDMVMQAEAGFISMNGTVGGELVKIPVALMDVIAAHQMKEAILMGLLARGTEKKGGYIEVSLYKSAISALANQATNYLMAGLVPKPLGTLHPNIAPYGDMVQTKDNKRVILAVGSDNQFEKLGKTLNLADDLRYTFRFNKDRVLLRTDLIDVLQRHIDHLDFEELERRLMQENVPFCLVADLEEVFKNPLAQEMVLEEWIEGQPTKRVSNTAFTIHMSDAKFDGVD